ncbi:SDR family NA [Sesbania bispinosa]|nr:SDR family NA [Sesbania bispinosa]
MTIAVAMMEGRLDGESGRACWAAEVVLVEGWQVLGSNGGDMEHKSIVVVESVRKLWRYRVLSDNGGCQRSLGGSGDEGVSSMDVNGGGHWVIEKVEDVGWQWC